MFIYKEFELKVIDLMTRGVLTSDVILRLTTEAIKLDCKADANGYRLITLHGSFPHRPVVCEKPAVRGICDGLASRFSISFRDGTMSLECHAIGIALPADWRCRDLEISVAT